MPEVPEVPEVEVVEDDQIELTKEPAGQTVSRPQSQKQSQKPSLSSPSSTQTDGEKAEKPAETTRLAKPKSAPATS